jgi:putative DNA primase/helicase
MKGRVGRLMRIRLEAIAEDEASSEFWAVIKFRDIDGRSRQLMLPRSDLDDMKVLRKTLTNAGCYFSKKQVRSKAALANLTKSAGAGDRWKLAARTGWYEGHRQFVHPDDVIGKLRGHISIKPPATRGESHTSALEIRGSHKEWVRSVATPAQGSSRMVLGICMSLAAPVLDFEGLNSFGILVHGPGKAGKSTMLLVAGSVIGFASERDLPNFRSTDAALGEMPASFNDMLLPLNELGLLKGGTTERSSRIRDLTYGFAEGRGTTYSKFSPMHKSNDKWKWRSILLATGEEAIEQISEEAGHTRASGEAIRWIDLRATRKAAEDIFDMAPKMLTGQTRKTWVIKQCVALREGCCTHHGVAFRHFIRHIIENRKTIKKDLSDLADQFVKNVTDQSDGHAVHHLAMCFAHIAAAGVLGVRFGTLPWTERFVVKCIKRCYRDARRALRTENDLLREGLRILKDGIRAKLLKVASKKSNSGSAWKAADGYREKSNHGTRVTIRGEAFKSWFTDQRQPAIVLRWLYSKNALCSKRGPSGNSAPAITWAESQPLWPDGSRPRSIILELRPGELSDSKK